MRIPTTGLSREQVFETLASYKKQDMPWKEGRTWAYLYVTERETESVIKQAYMEFLSENALDPTVFPSLLRLENEVVSMAARHLQGDSEVVGNFTSGGTESIILALKTARDYFRHHHPHIQRGEVILPVTAHAAFHKGCDYLGLKKVLVDVDPVTFRAIPERMKEAITPNTIMLVGSAISYAHGCVDPIREIAALALEHGLLCHVDGCMGGFLLPYFRRLGEPVEDFEFNVPGVTSISMDLHKYAFAAKGASVILHRNKALRRFQFWACANWTGYTMVNPTVQSTKSGGPLAGAWAALNFIGDAGYLDMARVMLEATRKIADYIDSHPDLYILGKREMNLLAFTSDTVNVFHIIDEMKQKAWYIQPQLGFRGSKENIHLSINPVSAPLVEDFLRDLGECVERAKALPSGELATGIRGFLEGINPADLTDEMLGTLLSTAGVAGHQLPERMAEINEILNSLPTELAEQVLISFLNNLYVQPE